MNAQTRPTSGVGLVSLFNRAVVTTLPLFPLPVVRFFAKKYIAGEELSDAIRVSRELNKKGIMATIDVLGESISRKTEALQAKEECIQVIEAIQKHQLDANISLKLTQLGLQLDPDLCFRNLQGICDAASKYHCFIRIDMEDSNCTDETIKLFLKMREYYSHCGIVLQAYLRRTEKDTEQLIQTRAHFRLCKGIYIEPEAIAFKQHDEINQNYLKILRQMLSAKSYVGIATHDDELVKGAYQIIDELKLQKSDYEFQMLLGVRESLRDGIVRHGHPLRVYVPFGKNWYKYSMRRFKENPQIAGYVLKSILLCD